MSVTVSPASDDAERMCDEGAVRDFVGYNLKRAYMVLYPAAQAAVADLGLRVPTFSCLSVIVENPGISPSVLAARLRMERSNVVVVIDELESLDLVTRAPLPTDRRRSSLTATVRGRRMLDKAATAMRASEDALLTGLSTEERALLVDLLNRIEQQSADAARKSAQGT